MSMKWTMSVAVVAFLASGLAAAAQDTANRFDVARYGAASEPAGSANATTGRAGTPAGDRVDSGEPALVENGWDFSRPETIPGFGPWQPTDDAAASKRAAAE